MRQICLLMYVILKYNWLTGFEPRPLDFQSKTLTAWPPSLYSCDNLNIYIGNKVVKFSKARSLSRVFASSYELVFCIMYFHNNPSHFLYFVRIFCVSPRGHIKFYYYQNSAEYSRYLTLFFSCVSNPFTVTWFCF